MPTGLSNHEVVRIQRQVLENGFNIIQEFSFLGDHSICQRLTIVAETGSFECLAGWQRIPYEWPDMKELIRVIFKKERQGYISVWSKSYGPEPTVNDFMQMVEW